MGGEGPPLLFRAHVGLHGPQVQTGWLCCAASGPGGDLSGAFIPSPAPAHSAPHRMWPLPPQVSLTMSLEQVWVGSYPRGAGRWRAAAPPRVRSCHAQARACQRPGTGRGRWTRGAAASTALHGGRGTACHPPPLVPRLPPSRGSKGKAGGRAGSCSPKDVRVPGASHTLSPHRLSEGPVAGRVLSPPSLLTCETPNLPNLSDVTVSPPTWAPGPAPALPVLRFRLAPHSSATCPSPAPRPRRPCPPPPPGCGSLSAPDERTGGSGSLESCGLRAASQHIGPAPLSSKTLAPSMQSRDGEQSRGGL